MESVSREERVVIGVNINGLAGEANRGDEEVIGLYRYRSVSGRRMLTGDGFMLGCISISRRGTTG